MEKYAYSFGRQNLTDDVLRTAAYGIPDTLAISQIK